MLAVTTVAILANGCSFIALEPAPRSPPVSAPVACDTDHWAPAADLAVYGAAMLFGLLTGLVVGIDDHPKAGAQLLVGSFGVIAMISGASGYYGMHHLRRCRSFHGIKI